MRLSWQHADFEALASLWNSTVPAKYPIDAELLKQNTIDSPVFDWGASAIEVMDDQILGFIAVKRSANPQLYRGPSYDQSHISALVCVNGESGVDLIAHAKGVLRPRGVDKLVFGQDSRHFWPGCPTDCPRLTSLLMVSGFEPSADAHDLESDLSAYDDSAYDEALTKASARVRICTDTDRPALSQFLRKEFPGRWEYDVKHKIEVEARTDFVMLLDVAGSIEGFALLQNASHRVPIAGATWRGSLGQNWATLGPIGVSRGVRGKGLGDALLGKSLGTLRDSGHRRCLIDWTTLVDWYGKHGFTVTRTYTPMTLRLDSEVRH